MKSKTGRLHVSCNASSVGTLTKDSSGGLHFQYSEPWIELERNFPISRSMPLTNVPYKGAVVINFFGNLLPDSEEVKSRIMARSGAAGTDPFSLLEAIGGDCVGALQFNSDGEVLPPDQEEMTEVSIDEIAQMISDLEITPLGVTHDHSFRISVAGAQGKTALKQKDGKWWRPKGSTSTTHIIKPPIGKLKNGMDMTKSVENEFFCLKFFSNCLIPTAESHIQEFAGRKALVVKRFDRVEASHGRIKRIPQEDYCQVFGIPSSQKYEKDGGPGILRILEDLNQSDQREADRAHFFLTHVLFWILAATDGHGKNFSILLKPGGGFQLSPIYDVLSMEPCFRAAQIRRNQVCLAMKVGDKKHDGVYRLLPRHFLQTAKSANLPVKECREMLELMYENIPILLQKTNSEMPDDFPPDIAESISKGVLERAKLLNFIG